MFTVLKFFHRSLLQQMARVQKGEAVGNAAGALNIVGHHHQRRVVVGLDVDQQLIDFPGRDRIQPGAGLVATLPDRPVSIAWL